MISRRLILSRYAAWLALTGLAGSGAKPAAAHRTKFTNDPFSLGVAAGDPTSDGFVIWTRLAPEPLQPDGGLPPEDIPVAWTVASDAGMTKVVRRGTTSARASQAHAVHVEVRGLSANRPYWYRFQSGAAASAIGRAGTTPLLQAPLKTLRVAFASCQNYEQGFYHPYRHLVADQPDLIVHLGDYIYENNSGLIARRHAGPEPVDLAGYRVRHALYKTDPDLQSAHAHCAWLMTWDDHEVDNDYAGFLPEDDMDPAAFLKRRIAAYRAYFEHMPLRQMARPQGPEMRLHHRVAFGNLVSFDILDTRQYRSDQACAADDAKGARFLTRDMLAACPQIDGPAQTMLGEDQWRWFKRGFGRTGCRWNAIVQQTLMAPFNWAKDSDAPRKWNSDTWDGYPDARQQLLAHIRDKKIPNGIVLGADLHAFWANDLYVPGTTDAAIATEYLTGSISSRGYSQSWLGKAQAHNPHVKFVRGDRRGYSIADIDADKWRIQFRTVQSPYDPESPVSTLAVYETANGKPGAISSS